MSYTRTTALSYLNGEFDSVLTEFSMVGRDDATGLKSVLDRAFRALGVGQADLPTASVEDAGGAKLEAALDYYALQRFVRAAANRVSVSKTTGGNSVSKQYQQLYDHLAADLATAKAIAEELGALGTGGWTYGSYNLDFLEPELADGLG